MSIKSPIKARIVNEVASILNKFWKPEIQPHLKNSVWRNSMKLLQDVVGDEFKKEERSGLRWLQGKMQTEEFVKNIAGLVQRYLLKQQKHG